MTPRPSPDDWRRQGQERYLRGVTLVLRVYRPRGETWDFRDELQWVVAPPPEP